LGTAVLGYLKYLLALGLLGNGREERGDGKDYGHGPKHSTSDSTGDALSFSFTYYASEYWFSWRNGF
jgi:hypothetical protein